MSNCVNCANWGNGVYQEQVVDNSSYCSGCTQPSTVVNSGRVDERTFQTGSFGETRVVREFAAPKTYTDYVWYEIKYAGPFHTGVIVGEPSQADIARNNNIADKIAPSTSQGQGSCTNQCGCSNQCGCGCPCQNNCCCSCCNCCRR